MKQELQEKLYTKYPKIFGQKDLPMSQTAMCWGLDIGDGWYSIIDELCNLIQHHIDNKELPQVEATQVKEKFGGLRFYTNHTDEYTDGLISMAESMSYKICEICGNAGSPNESGWIITLCESCKINKK